MAVDYRTLDFSGLVQHGLIPPSADLLRGAKSGKRLAALWSLAGCLRAAQGKPEEAYVVRGERLDVREEGKLVPVQWTISWIAEKFRMSDEDVYLLQDLTACENLEASYARCREWTGEGKRPGPITLPQLPEVGSEAAHSWLAVLTRVMLLDQEDDDSDRGEDQSDADDRPAEGIESFESGKSEDDNCPTTSRGMAEDSYDLLGPITVAVLQDAIEGKLPPPPSKSGMGVEDLKEAVIKGLDEIVDEAHRMQYLETVLWAIQSERMPVRERLNKDLTKDAMKEKIGHDTLMTIFDRSTDRPGSITGLWDTKRMYRLYKKLYPTSGHELEFPGFVPDTDEVLRNVNNMIMGEIIQSGNFDQTDVRSMIPLTKDEVITEIKKAATAPDSLTSLLSAGVARMQLIADQFVSGLRPLDKNLVENIRVDHRVSHSEPVDSDPIPIAPVPRAQPTLYTKSLEERLKAFMEQDD